MKVRLVEIYDPVRDRTEYKIQRLLRFPWYWAYVWGSDSETLCRATFQRIKKTKAVLEVVRVLDTATL